MEYSINMVGLTKKDIKEINRLKGLFPDELTVYVRASEDGGLVCEIKTFQGCFTQGENLFELVQMVNDAVYTYFDVPQKYVSYMPNFGPSVKMAHEFSGLPLPTRKNLHLKLLNRETAKV